MALYSAGFKTTDVTINHACLEIITAATCAIRIMEIGISQVTATACEYALGRPQAVGITPVPVLFTAEQSTADPAAKTNYSLSAATSATIPLATQTYRRLATVAAVGAGVIWTFPRGLYLPASASMVLFNVTTGVALDAWVVIDE